MSNATRFLAQAEATARLARGSPNCLASWL
jgi:hypothetical protein